MLHGTNQANCMKRHRRKTISNGERKREGAPQRRTLSIRRKSWTGRWCWEYSSDETPDENAPQPAEGAEAPKRVKKQIHLTLPTGPAHVTTTETFATFFINHGLTRALQKAFAKKRLEYRPDEGICHQLPEETWTASPNAQNLRG